MGRSRQVDRGLRQVGMNSQRMQVSAGRAMRRGRMSSDMNSAGISRNGWRNLMGRVAVEFGRRSRFGRVNSDGIS